MVGSYRSANTVVTHISMNWAGLVSNYFPAQSREQMTQSSPSDEITIGLLDRGSYPDWDWWVRVSEDILDFHEQSSSVRDTNTYKILHNSRGIYTSRHVSISTTVNSSNDERVLNKYQTDFDKFQHQIKQTISIYFDDTRQNQSQFVLTAVQGYTFWQYVQSILSGFEIQLNGKIGLLYCLLVLLYTKHVQTNVFLANVLVS